MKVSESIIREMVNTIVQEVHPDFVYLFGSHATGTAHKDSDIDFLVVKPLAFDRDNNRWKEMQRIRKALRTYRIAKDVLVYSSTEFQELSKSQNHVTGQVARDGKLLYERH